MASRGSRNHLSLRTQRNLLAMAYPFEVCEIRHGVLIWEGHLQPTPLSRSYFVRIDYKPGEFPKIYGLAPNLTALAAKYFPDRRLPHVYSEDPAQLCVFHPKKQEWHPADSLAATIVPWSIAWLTFFEDWLLTDVWSGGGEHPVRPTLGQHLPEDRRFEVDAMIKPH